MFVAPDKGRLTAALGCLVDCAYGAGYSAPDLCPAAEGAGRLDLDPGAGLRQLLDLAVIAERRSNGEPQRSTEIRHREADEGGERFDRELAEKLSDIFTALFAAGTRDKDTAALSLLVHRAVPVRKGVPVNFKTFGDILAAIGEGELTAKESDGMWVSCGCFVSVAAKINQPS